MNVCEVKAEKSNEVLEKKLSRKINNKKINDKFDTM